LNIISVTSNYFLVFFGILFFTSCNEYESELLTLDVITEIADCEEENIHVKIIDSEKKLFIGKYILPVCDTVSPCKTFLYALKKSDSLDTYTIQGYMSKKVHKTFDYGCTDSKFFKIIEISYTGKYSKP